MSALQTYAVHDMHGTNVCLPDCSFVSMMFVPIASPTEDMTPVEWLRKAVKPDAQEDKASSILACVLVFMN